MSAGAAEIVRKRPGRPRTKRYIDVGDGPNPILVVVKVSGEWGEWLRGFSEATGIDCQDLIATGLAMHAKAVGHQSPPPRTGRKAG